MERWRGILRAAGWAMVLAVVGPAGASAAETAGPPAAVQRQEPAPQAADRPTLPQGMMMVCPMMGGMGLSGMGPYASGLSMNHGTGQAATVTDLAQNVSLRDLALMFQDLVAVQERMLQRMPRRQAAEVRRDLDRLKERSREFLTEIRAMISAAAGGE